MKNVLWWVIGAVAIAAGVALWWYFTDIAQKQKVEESTKMADVEVTVVGMEYMFTPKSITVGKGKVVELTFTNDGTMPHTFTIDGVVDTGLVGAGSSKTVTFTAPGVEGEYQYYCSVIGHKELGQVGTLKVE